jgi:hypothetical protein
MRSTQNLTRAVRDLLTLVDEEANRNPLFAERLEAIASRLSCTTIKKVSKPKPAAAEPPPDAIRNLQVKGEEEFRFWLRSLDLKTLKAIIKINGFDPAKASQRWRDLDKFVALIAEQTAARLRRGSAFLPAKASEESHESS